MQLNSRPVKKKLRKNLNNAIRLAIEIGLGGGCTALAGGCIHLSAQNTSLGKKMDEENDKWKKKFDDLKFYLESSLVKIEIPALKKCMEDANKKTSECMSQFQQVSNSASLALKKM